MVASLTEGRGSHAPRRVHRITQPVVSQSHTQPQCSQSHTHATQSSPDGRGPCCFACCTYSIIAHLATMSRLAPNPHRTPPPAEGGSVDWSALSHRVPVGAYRHTSPSVRARGAHPSRQIRSMIARVVRASTAGGAAADPPGGGRSVPHHTGRLRHGAPGHVRLDRGTGRDFTCNAEAQAAWG